MHENTSWCLSRQSGTPLFDLDTINQLFSQEPGHADPFGSAPDHVVHTHRLVDTSGSVVAIDPALAEDRAAAIAGRLVLMDAHPPLWWTRYAR